MSGNSVSHNQASSLFRQWERETLDTGHATWPSARRIAGDMDSRLRALPPLLCVYVLKPSVAGSGDSGERGRIVGTPPPAPTHSSPNSAIVSIGVNQIMSRQFHRRRHRCRIRRALDAQRQAIHQSNALAHNQLPIFMGRC